MRFYWSPNKLEDYYEILRNGLPLWSRNAVAVPRSLSKLGAEDNNSEKCYAVQNGTFLPDPDANKIFEADKTGESE